MDGIQEQLHMEAAKNLLGDAKRGINGQQPQTKDVADQKFEAVLTVRIDLYGQAITI